MKVSNWKSINKNALVGTFDLELSSGFLITGALLLKSADRQWVNMPAIPQFTKTGETYTPLMKEGKQVYKNVFSIPDRERRDKFSEQVISVLQSAGHI